MVGLSMTGLGEDVSVVEEKQRGLRIGSVVIDCSDFARMFAFWREALDYEPRDPAEDDWVVLRDPNGGNVNVSLQQVPEKRSGKNRLHFDLYAEDQLGEVDRLLQLGATRFDRKPEPGEDFIVLEDPEGNLFCVIDTSEH
jgi:catechol 2,3-dioxygenase-like lactoylglutathione lyase family enzyme